MKKQSPVFWPNKVALLNGTALTFQRVFKDKYYPTLLFGKPPVLTLLRGFGEVLLLVMRYSGKGWPWRVGNGKSCNIWTDPRIPRSYSFKILTKPSEASLLMHSVSKVVDLIDEDVHRWKED